jgi:hypothetical protein
MLDPLEAFLEEDHPGDHPEAEEIAYDSRAGCSVTVYGIEGRFFVEWSADEGTESGWEEIDLANGPGQKEEAMGQVKMHLALYSDSDEPDDEDFGLINNAGPSELATDRYSMVGTVIFHCSDDSQLPGVQIWATDEGSLVVTRKYDGEVLGGYPDLGAIRAKITSPHPYYRPHLERTGSFDWEPWD